MPDFDFPERSVMNAGRTTTAEEAENAMTGRQGHSRSAAENGTGWDSVASIERPESLRGRAQARRARSAATLGGFGDASAPPRAARKQR